MIWVGMELDDEVCDVDDCVLSDDWWWLLRLMLMWWLLYHCLIENLKIWVLLYVECVEWWIADLMGVSCVCWWLWLLLCAVDGEVVCECVCRCMCCGVVNVVCVCWCDWVCYDCMRMMSTMMCGWRWVLDCLGVEWCGWWWCVGCEWCCWRWWCGEYVVEVVLLCCLRCVDVELWMCFGSGVVMWLMIEWCSVDGCFGDAWCETWWWLLEWLWWCVDVLLCVGWVMWCVECCECVCGCVVWMWWWMILFVVWFEDVYWVCWWWVWCVCGLLLYLLLGCVGVRWDEWWCDGMSWGVVCDGFVVFRIDWWSDEDRQRWCEMMVVCVLWCGVVMRYGCEWLWSWLLCIVSDLMMRFGVMMYRDVCMSDDLIVSYVGLYGCGWRSDVCWVFVVCVFAMTYGAEWMWDLCVLLVMMSCVCDWTTCVWWWVKRWLVWWMYVIVWDVWLWMVGCVTDEC